LSILWWRKMTERFIFNKVVCDETNNTKEDIENGVVNVDIYGVVVDKIDIIDITLEITEWLSQLLLSVFPVSPLVSICEVWWMTNRNISKEIFHSYYRDMEDGNDTETICYPSLICILEELIDRIEQLERRLDKNEL